MAEDTPYSFIGTAEAYFSKEKPSGTHTPGQVPTGMTKLFGNNAAVSVNRSADEVVVKIADRGVLKPTRRERTNPDMTYQLTMTEHTNETWKLLLGDGVPNPANSWEGYCYLRFDDMNNVAVAEHLPFKCNVVADGNFEATGTGNSEATLLVTVDFKEPGTIVYSEE